MAGEKRRALAVEFVIRTTHATDDVSSVPHAAAKIVAYLRDGTTGDEK
jgi:hypothetical protein